MIETTRILFQCRYELQNNIKQKYEIQISVDGKQISGSTIVPETLSFTQNFHRL